jgi:hypothetical protein
MTFTELMALDNKPDKPKPAVAQANTKRLIHADKTERPERGEREEGPVRPVRVSPPSGSSEQPHKREIKRHAFEIYKDQIESLQQMKINTMKTGQLKSMSAMVREALDNFINNQR